MYVCVCVCVRARIITLAPPPILVSLGWALSAAM